MKRTWIFTIPLTLLMSCTRAPLGEPLEPVDPDRLLIVRKQHRLAADGLAAF